MFTSHEQFESGWIGISIALGDDEIDQLIEQLLMLKSKQIGHFHFRRDDFSAKCGIADMEISLRGPDDIDNMHIE